MFFFCQRIVTISVSMCRQLRRGRREEEEYYKDREEACLGICPLSTVILLLTYTILFRDIQVTNRYPFSSSTIYVPWLSGLTLVSCHHRQRGSKILYHLALSQLNKGIMMRILIYTPQNSLLPNPADINDIILKYQILAELCQPISLNTTCGKQGSNIT